MPHPQHTTTPLLLDIRAAADLLGFSYSTIRHWTYRSKRPPAHWPQPVKINTALRYRAADLENWVAHIGQPDRATGEDAATPISQPPPARRGRPRQGYDLKEL
jgi:predicted DNA-binding transcriptional regulator AlpA